MNICVLDNDEEYLEKTARLAASYFEQKNVRTEIITVNSGKALKRLDIDKLDILLSGINLGEGEENGIYLARQIKLLNPSCQIIFISNFLNYATDVYSTEHVWFLLKDQMEERLPIALHKAMRNLYPPEIPHVFFKRGRERLIINTASIICIESNQRKVILYCIDRIEETYASISELEKQLPRDRFVRCHKSYIINLAMVERYGAKELMLAGELCVPVSRQYRVAIKDELMEYSVMMLGDRRV